MNPSDPESQTPPAKVLFPLGATMIGFPLLCLLLWDLGPVANMMMFVLIVMGAGMIWQGTKNLKRDRQ